MSYKVKSRWLAFGIHLSISLIVLMALLSLIFFVWFPHDLIFAGGINGLKILMGVDLILGPLLTLIVYKHGKKGLAFDLTLIALLQFACLFAGTWLVFNERPLVQLLADDGVHLLAASDFKQYDIQLSALPGSYPKHVLLELPEDLSILDNIKFNTELVDNKPFTFRDDLYLPIEGIEQQRFSRRIEFIQSSMSAAELARLNNLHNESCAWVPLTSKHNFGYACTSFSKGIIRLSDRGF
jgi:hypothetical protein